MTLEQRMGWVEQRQGTNDYRVQALQDSMIELNRFSLKLDRKLDTFEENLAAVARDLQQFKEETRLSLTAIAKHLDVDLNPPTSAT